MKLTLIALVVASSLAYTALGCRPIFRIYESRGYGNDYVENAVELVALEDVWDISEHGLEHSRMYICVQGVWLGYKYEGFAGRNNLDYNYVKMGGALQCSYENLGRYYKSLRIVGDPRNYHASALVNFQERWNEMAATTYLNDTEQLINPRMNSFILMGSQEIELFAGPNFTGASRCIGPNGVFFSKSYFDRDNDNRNGTHLFTNVAELDTILEATEFHSFRFGCSSN